MAHLQIEIPDNLLAGLSEDDIDAMHEAASNSTSEDVYPLARAHDC